MLIVTSRTILSISSFETSERRDEEVLEDESLLLAAVAALKSQRGADGFITTEAAELCIYFGSKARIDYLGAPENQTNTQMKSAWNPWSSPVPRSSPKASKIVDDDSEEDITSSTSSKNSTSTGLSDILDEYRRTSSMFPLSDSLTTKFSVLNTEAPLQFIFKTMTDPTDPTDTITKLGAVYWVPKRFLPKSYDKQPWYDQCIVEPLDVSYVTKKVPAKAKYAHKLGNVDKTYSLVYDTTDYVGFPRFLGLSLFGAPEKDGRSEGDRIEYPSWTTEAHRSMRPEQDLGIQWALEDLAKWGGCFIEADCGVGKTCMSLNLVYRLGRRAMFIVPNLELLEQVKEASSTWMPGISIGIIKGAKSFAKFNFDSTHMAIASIDTLVSAGPDVPKDFFKKFGTIVVDEAHHIAAKCLSQVLPLLPSKNIIGLSATPDRSDGLQAVIHWLLGPLSFRFQRLPKILEATGLPFVKTVVHWISYGHRLSDADSESRNLPLVVQQQRLARNIFRDNLILNTVVPFIKDERRVLILTLFCDHADRLYENMCARGLEHLTGLDTGSSIKGVPKATAKYLIRTWQKCGEGYDDKTLTDLVLMLPRKTIQQVIGRVQRVLEGKLYAHVWDIIDDNFPDGTVQGMRASRARFYRDRGIRRTEAF